MPVFEFEAVARGGGNESGSLEAPSRTAALRTLRERGLQPLRLNEESATAKPLADAIPKAARSRDDGILEAKGADIDG